MYNIECECIICTNQNRSKVTMAIDFTENALFLETIKPATTPVPEFRKWSRSKIGQHEKKVIEFLEKYNEFHPNHGVRVVQGFLVMMWHILATRVYLAININPNLLSTFLAFSSWSRFFIQIYLRITFIHSLNLKVQRFKLVFFSYDLSTFIKIKVQLFNENIHLKTNSDDLYWYEFLRDYNFGAAKNCQ